MTSTRHCNPLRRVLFISYAFPPVGGAGVQRVTKFIKYLRRAGWESSVLTVANPSVPVMDYTLTDELPEATPIVRARTFEPGYAAKKAVGAGVSSSWSGRVRKTLRAAGAALLQPDAQILWNAPAFRAGARFLRREPHDAIIVSGPPFSSFLLGAALARRFEIPLVLDYRDEWDLTNQYWENKQLGPLSLAFQRWIHRRVVGQASALVATTEMSARSLEAVRDSSGSQARVTCVYNGYDPDDFANVPSVRASALFRLVYTGTLWAATSIEPLAAGIALLREHSPVLAASLEVVIAGRVTPEQQGHLDKIAWLLPGRVTQRPYVDHAEAVGLMQSADALCLLLSNLPGIARVMPAKTFEYLAARKPIVAIVPQGEASAVLDQVPHAFTTHPNDVTGLAACLADRIDAWRAGRNEVPAHWNPIGFDRPAQAAELAALLSSLCGFTGTRVLEPKWSSAGRLA